MTSTKVVPAGAEVEVEAAAAAARAALADEASRRHAVVNALTAIEGASSILVSDRLSAEDRATISGLLISAVQRLRPLVDGAGLRRGPISLASVADEVRRRPEWSRLVEVDVAPELVADGSAGLIAEAIGQLLGWGRTVTAPPMVLRGRRSGSEVGLLLEAASSRPVPRDAPMPVPAQVASRLLREQGGDVRVEVGPGGAIAIGLWFPADECGGAGDGGG